VVILFLEKNKMEQGLIYDPSAVSRIENLLNQQEELFKQEDKNSKVQNQKIIRFGIIFGISVISILVLKAIIKKKK